MKSPTDDCGFNLAICFHALPSAIVPSTRGRNDIRTDAILAKEFEWLVRRRCAVMGEGIDALLPLCHLKNSR